MSLVIAHDRFYGHRPLPEMGDAELEGYVLKALVGGKPVDGGSHGGSFSGRLPKKREKTKVKPEHYLGLVDKALHGGRAEKEGKKPSDFPKKKLKEGARHEKEHTDDESTAEQIAADHLAEDPDYYRKIKKIEKAIGTRDTDKHAAKQDAKRAAPRAPAKATKVTSSQGSKQYDYPETKKKAPGKSGGAKKPAAPGADPKEAEMSQGGMINPVDPSHLASLLHVQVEDLQKLALRYPVEQFITYFKVHFALLMRVHKFPRTYLEELHEALVHRTPVEKGLRGHRAYTRRARSGKMSLIPNRPGAKMNQREVDQLRTRHTLRYDTFKPGDVIKHPDMGLGVVTNVFTEGGTHLLSASFTSLNEKYAREHEKEVAAHLKKYKKPLNTETTVGSLFVTKVTVKAGGKTDALRSSIMGVRNRRGS